MGLTEDLSKSQIDKLGDRLRKGSPSEEDLILLDRYRLSFSHSYETVFSILKQELRERVIIEEATGRVAKSTISIIEKLGREKTRLSSMQDIAGCRLVVPDIRSQEEVIELLTNSPIPIFSEMSVIDRRTNPSHGYRAIHVIVKIEGKPVEIQIRSRLQHLWAELSEKFSDNIDPSIKYGGGDESFLEYLAKTSEIIAKLEEMEKEAFHNLAILKDITEFELTEKSLFASQKAFQELGFRLSENNPKWGLRLINESLYLEKLAKRIRELRNASDPNKEMIASLLEQYNVFKYFVEFKKDEIGTELEQLVKIISEFQKRQKP